MQQRRHPSAPSNTPTYEGAVKELRSVSPTAKAPAQRQGHPHAPGRHRLHPPGEEHWHGATADNMMCHLAMLEGTAEGDGTPRRRHQRAGGNGSRHRACDSEGHPLMPRSVPASTPGARSTLGSEVPSTRSPRGTLSSRTLTWPNPGPSGSRCASWGRRHTRPARGNGEHRSEDDGTLATCSTSGCPGIRSRRRRALAVASHGWNGGGVSSVRRSHVADPQVAADIWDRNRSESD
jgi:hypothetical protein